MVRVDKRYLMVGIIALGVGGMYYVNQNTYPEVLIAKHTVAKGSELKEEYFQKSKVLEKKEWMLEHNTKFDVKVYAKQDIPSGEYLSTNALTKYPLIDIRSGEGIVGIKAINKEEVVGWQLRPGDVVSIANYDKEKKKSFLDPRLDSLVLVALINRDGLDISNSKDSDRTDIETYNVKGTLDQLALIDEYSRKGDIRLIKRVEGKEDSKVSRGTESKGDTGS